MSESIDEVRAMRARLDKVSPSMCLAKWLQVTVHLHNGQTHSCHHPDTHSVPLDELAANPSALHNTSFKKRQRRAMLEGERPKECDYCWRIEDASKESLSDRFIKSSDAWARPHFDAIAQAPWDADVDPTYLEVSFGNLCNMRCAYCSPNVSSSWMEELKKHGPYPTEQPASSFELMRERGKTPLAPDAPNPYVDAFWKWWPSARQRLEVLRVTGGEPLLSPHTFRLMDEILEGPASGLELCVNTNLMVPADRIDRFVEKARAILDAKKVARFGVFTSLDAWGTRGEYIRHGLKHDSFWRNVARVVRELPEAELVFMCTFNALSVTSFRPLQERLLEMRKAGANVVLDVAYLRDPAYQSLKVLTTDFVPMVGGHVRFMEQNRQSSASARDGFSGYEIEKMQRVFEWMKKPEADEYLSLLRRDFYVFFAEHDRRRQTNFLATFPEMSEFWRLCRGLARARGVEDPAAKRAGPAPLLRVPEITEL